MWIHFKTLIIVTLSHFSISFKAFFFDVIILWNCTFLTLKFSKYKLCFAFPALHINCILFCNFWQQWSHNKIFSWKLASWGEMNSEGNWGPKITVKWSAHGGHLCNTYLPGTMAHQIQFSLLDKDYFEQSLAPTWIEYVLEWTITAGAALLRVFTNAKGIWKQIHLLNCTYCENKIKTHWLSYWVCRC